MATYSPAAGKRGELTGGALTDEALDSSKSVLQQTMYGSKQRGLQQYFTPPEAAEFIKAVIDPLGRSPVLDPTAGSGALLTPGAKPCGLGSSWTAIGCAQASMSRSPATCSARSRCCSSSGSSSRESSPIHRSV